MSYIDVKQIVDENVFVNGQNLVTAQMVNTAITAVINQSSTYIGDADSLPVGQNLIEAIAILNARIPDSEFPLKVLLGTTDPNTTPPAGANNGDFYIRNSSKVYQLSSGVWYSFEDIDFDLRTSIIDSVLKQNLDDGDTFIRLDANDGLSLKKITWANIVDALGNIFIRIGSNLGALISSDAGNNITTGSDGGLYSSGGLTQIDWGDIYGDISNQLDLWALIGNYLPLTGGTLTGSLSATNFETEKGIEFLSNIEISKLLASGELAVRITDTGVPIYVFNETGTPTNPKDVITKEFFDANAGGGNVIEVTVSDPNTEHNRIGSTTSGNYVPEIGDMLIVNFTNGVRNSINSLDIDGSGSVDIRIFQSVVSGSFNNYVANCTMGFWYNGETYQLYGQLRPTPDGLLGNLLTGTRTTNELWSAKVLTDWIDQKYVPMLGFKTQTLKWVLTPLDEDLTTGEIEYKLTIDKLCVCVNWNVDVQVAPQGSSITVRLMHNGATVGTSNKPILANEFNSFSYVPPSFAQKTFFVGDTLHVFIDNVGAVAAGQCLTIHVEVEPYT